MGIITDSFHAVNSTRVRMIESTISILMVDSIRQSYYTEGS